MGPLRSRYTFGCRVPCTGLFADVNVKKINPISRETPEDFNIENIEERQKFELLFAQYRNYKTMFVEKINTEFDIYTGHSGYNYSK